MMMKLRRSASTSQPRGTGSRHASPAQASEWKSDLAAETAHRTYVRNALVRNALTCEQVPSSAYLPNVAALIRGPNHRRVSLAAERLLKFRQIRDRTDHAKLRNRMRIRLDHQPLRRRPRFVAAE